MPGRRVHLEIDVDVVGASISGRVTSEGPAARSFSGRLGLITAIDEVLAVDEQADVNRE